jgi:putative ABC transport system permease protein
MRKAIWKSLLHQRSRLFFSVIAVVLGVAFMSGVAVVASSVINSVNAITKGKAPDLLVAPAGSYTSQNNPLGTKPVEFSVLITQNEVSQAESVPGVSSVSGVIYNNNTYLLNAGKMIVGFSGLPGFGYNYFTTPAADGEPGIEMVEGEAPRNDGEVAVDPQTLSKGGYRINDEVQISTPGGIVKATVTGTATFSSDRYSSSSYIFFPTRVAQQTFLGQRAYQNIWISVDPSTDPAQVVEGLNKVIPTGYQVYTADEVLSSTRDYLGTNLGFVSVVLVAFAILGLFVAGFQIRNMFHVVVQQRYRELALYRVLGASSSQVRNSMLTQAGIIGFIGTTLGLVIGVGLAFGVGLLDRWYFLGIATPSLPSLTTGLLILLGSYVIGIGITLVAAWSPAARAGAMSTRDLLIHDENADLRPSRRASIFYWVALLVGLLLITVVLVSGLLPADFPQLPHPVWWLASGTVLALIGLAYQSPVVGRPLIWIMGLFYRLLFRGVGRLAKIFESRSPRRMASTASTLVVSMAAVAALAVLTASSVTSVRTNIEANSRGDLLLTTATYAAMDQSVAQSVRKADGVMNVFEMRSVQVETADAGSVELDGYQPEAFDMLQAQTLVDGRMMSRRWEALISKDYAEQHTLGIGATIDIQSPVSQEPVQLNIVGIFNTPVGGQLSPISVNLNTIAELGNAGYDDMIVIYKVPDLNFDEFLGNIDEITTNIPAVSVLDQSQYISAQIDRASRLVWVVYALLVLAVVVTMMAAGNALNITMLSRIADLALLRSLGMAKRQLRLLLILESVAATLVGTVLGVLLGVLFAAALQQTLTPQGLTDLSVPWTQLGIILAASLFVGIFAAQGPAQSAGRVNVLQVFDI